MVGVQGRGTGPGRWWSRLPRTGLSTRRAAVLALVVCALALTLAVPLRTYVSQRQQLADTARTQAQLTSEVSALQGQLDQLDDPAYVRAQARERLQYVLPGQTPYEVQLPGGASGAGSGASAPSSSSGPWFSDLWSAVRSGG